MRDDTGGFIDPDDCLINTNLKKAGFYSSFLKPFDVNNFKTYIIHNLGSLVYNVHSHIEQTFLVFELSKTLIENICSSFEGTNIYKIYTYTPSIERVHIKFFSE